MWDTRIKRINNIKMIVIKKNKGNLNQYYKYYNRANHEYIRVSHLSHRDRGGSP